MPATASPKEFEKKGLLRIFLPFFILITIVAFSLKSAYVDHEIHEVKVGMESQSKITEMVISNELKRIILDLYFLSRFDEINQKENKIELLAFQEELHTFMEMSRSYRDLSMYREDGSPVLQVVRGLDGKGLSVAKDRIQNLNDSSPQLLDQLAELHLQDLYISGVTNRDGEAYLSLIKPFGNSDAPGYLKLDVALIPLMKGLNTGGLKGSRRLSLLDRDFNWIAGFESKLLKALNTAAYLESQVLKSRWLENEEGIHFTNELVISQVLRSTVGKGNLKVGDVLYLSNFVPQVEIYQDFQFVLAVFWLVYAVILIFTLAVCWAFVRVKNQHREIEESSQKSEEPYRLIVEKSRDAIVIIKNEVVIFGNSAASDLLECPIEVLENQWASTFVHSHSATDLTRFLLSPNETTIKGLKIDLKTFKNHSITVEILAGEIEFEGGDAILATFRDITGRKKADEEMFESIRASEEASQSKSRFLANVSHEVRGPLNIIMGNTELLDHSGINEEQTGYSKAIVSSAKNLLQIIDEVSALSKVDAGDLELEEVIFDLKQTVHDVIEEYSAEAEEQGNQLNIEMEDTIPTLLKGDPARLTQIISNLVSNGIKYTSNGEITVSVSLEEAFSDLFKYRFEISDTGQGIPIEDQDGIFDSFKSAGQTNHGGTGLGLAICKSLVVAMNGEIYIESEMNVGTKFIFTVYFLPTADSLENQELKDDKGLLRQDLEGCKLLVVDDKALNQALVKQMLEKFGAKVHVAGNGQEAIEWIQSESYNLVIMDVQMPIMDGLTATRKIRETTNGSLDPDIPIIALTAHALKDDRVACLNAGMNDYLTKPVYVDRLRKMVIKYAKPIVS
ncbi:MAG: response regulator [SAR324 cluster bacterium]|nr:response regulator [SAR324 cluster bacterium]